VYSNLAGYSSNSCNTPERALSTSANGPSASTEFDLDLHSLLNEELAGGKNWPVGVGVDGPPTTA
jgi:hypothetical protein